jgi:hypothetical protein
LDNILDCESQDSTYRSLSNLFGCSKKALVSLLSAIHIDEIYQNVENSPDIAPDEYVFQEAIKKFRVNPVPHYVCWFHLTRTTQSATFAQGILPLGIALGAIWETLSKIFEGTVYHSNLVELKTTGIVNYHYNLKTPDAFHWGPFAMLVKETAFKASEMGNHDYLRLPEIIEDICNGYYDRFGSHIHEYVVNSLKPCIVKFKSLGRVDDGCIKAALYYLHVCIHKKNLCIDANTCFDGKGKIVPFENIIKIEIVDLP